jgi:hypothetical protein
MFLTNRSLLALWLAILSLSLFVLLTSMVTQENSYFPGWASMLEIIFFFAMTTIQTVIGQVNPQKAKDESVQEPPKPSGLLRFLGSVMSVVVVFGVVLLFTFLRLFLKTHTLYLDALLWTVCILLVVAQMVFTLRSQRRAGFEKRKQTPPISD